jgi:hypothetical protein
MPLRATRRTAMVAVPPTDCRARSRARWKTRSTSASPECGSIKAATRRPWTRAVQQGEGRVAATTQYKGVEINDDAGFERQADKWGSRAARAESVGDRACLPAGRRWRDPAQDRPRPRAA